MKVCTACRRQFDVDDWHCPRCGHHPPTHKGFIALAPDLAKTNDNWDAEFFAHLAENEQRHFWFRARNRLIIWALRRFFPHARNFLEIGCGTGFVLHGLRRAFPRLNLAGSDIYSEGLAFAQNRLPDVPLFQMDARQMPFDDEFDVIGAFDVLEHIEEDLDVLLQMHRAARPGGGVIITVPQHRFLWSVVDDFSYHKRRYAHRELVNKLRTAGFKVVRVSSFVTTLLPVMLLSRLKQPKSVKEFNPTSELRIARATNAILETALEAERFAIQSGFSLPFGGSLLAVARRSETPKPR